MAEGVRHIERSRELDPTVVGPVPPELLALAEPPLLCRQWGELCRMLPLRMVETLTKLVAMLAVGAVVAPGLVLLDRREAAVKKARDAAKKRE